MTARQNWLQWKARESAAEKLLDMMRAELALAHALELQGLHVAARSHGRKAASHLGRSIILQVQS